LTTSLQVLFGLPLGLGMKCKEERKINYIKDIQRE